jgi:hypothetical protein
MQLKTIIKPRNIKLNHPFALLTMAHPSKNESTYQTLLGVLIVPPLLLTMASPIAFFLLVFAIPGVASPNASRGLDIIFNTLMYYPFVATPLLIVIPVLGYFILSPRDPSVWLYVGVLYAIFIHASLSLIRGINLVLNG